MFVKSILSIAALFGPAAICGPLLDLAGDPGGGGAPAGGGAPPAEPTADPAQADPAGAADAGAEHVDAPDLDDDPGNDDRDDEEFVKGLPEPNLRTRVRRAQRYRRDTEPIVNLLRGQDGKILPAQEVSRLLARAREMEQLDPLLRDPEALRAVMAAEERLRTGGKRAAAEDEHPAFDEKAFDEAWPYEVDSKEGRQFFERQKAEAKRTHALEGDVKQLRRLVTGVQRTTQQAQLSTVENEAKALAFKASEEIDPLYRDRFLTAAGTHFRFLQSTGRFTPQSMKQFVENWLVPVRAAKAKQTRTTTARQSAMAAGNTTLPRTPRPGTVQPASGEPTNKRETIHDGRKSFLAKYAG